MHQHFKTRKLRRSYNFGGIDSFWMFKKEKKKIDKTK
jgi:hypothetical protein